MTRRDAARHMRYGQGLTYRATSSRSPQKRYNPRSTVRILLLSDIHSNLEALDACLAAAPPHDRVINLGDTVGYGANPNEVIARVRSLGGIFVRGNHDKAVSGLMDLEEFNPIVDEPGLAFQGLPEVPVEGPGREVANDLDFGVQVALADDAAFALGDVGGPPGGVEVVQGNGAVLDVSTDAGFFGGADQDGDVAGAAGGEQPGQVGVVPRLVHEPDRVSGQAAGGLALPTRLPPTSLRQSAASPRCCAAAAGPRPTTHS